MYIWRHWLWFVSLRGVRGKPWVYLGSLTVVFTLVMCQWIGLCISSITDCGVYACGVSEGRTVYI